MCEFFLSSLYLVCSEATDSRFPHLLPSDSQSTHGPSAGHAAGAYSEPLLTLLWCGLLSLWNARAPNSIARQREGTLSPSFLIAMVGTLTTFSSMVYVHDCGRSQHPLSPSWSARVSLLTQYLLAHSSSVDLTRASPGFSKCSH